MKLSYEIGHKSTPSSIHEYQDRLIVDEKNLLFAVADGVSKSFPRGSNGGLAAEIVVSRLRMEIASGKSLADAIGAVNYGVDQMRKFDRKVGETTITAGKIANDRIQIANVGDSPAYMLRRNKFRRLHTQDTGPYGDLSAAIGYSGNKLNVHSKTSTLMPEDIVIIASDGIIRSIRSNIWNPGNPNVKRGDSRIAISARRLTEIVNSSKTLDIAATSMIEEISNNYHEMVDDKTVILIKAIARE